jgi:hypothetical protein
VRGVVRLLQGRTDPAAVPDLVTVVLGPLPHRGQILSGCPSGAPPRRGNRTAGLPGGFRDVRLQRLLQGGPVLLLLAIPGEFAANFSGLEQYRLVTSIVRLTCGRSLRLSAGDSMP